MKYLILTLVLYLIYKYVKYLYYSLSHTTQGGQFGGRNNDTNNRVHVDVDPKANEKKFKDGEYIDFEEVD